MIDAKDETEFDFSNDSTVENKEAVWTIIDAASEETDGDKGSGTRYNITFESDDWPFPIILKQFVSYTSKVGKDTAWVKRSRGVLKNISKAATGNATGTLEALIGQRVRATTKDDGNGFATLSKFRPMAP